MSSKYIEIVSAGLSATGKTKVFHIKNIRTGETCGVIKWYGGFRKYVFYPGNDMLFDHHCLQQIADFLKEINAAKRA